MNCTSVGLEPTDPSDALAGLGLTGLEPPAVVADLVYAAGPTPVERWASRGAPGSCRGGRCWSSRGRSACELWTGRPAPVAAMRAALD